MNPNNSTNSLYLDTDVAREQRQQAEAEMEINNAAHTEKQEGILQEGILADMKHQLDTITSTNSVSDIGNSISSAAQENAVAVKEIIMDGAVPAAQDALHTVQDRISAISGKGAEETEYEGLFFTL
ncbi:hypothetical protein N7475_002990 [Penicillium sp. IBT 31633x]|nr:hypothetical protein N7475_002990 [Penicillium sp. IBT 31633x]